MDRSLVEVALYVFFGPEDLIPDNFTKLQCLLGRGSKQSANFADYLKRQIDLDGNGQGPSAHETLMALQADDEHRWDKAARAGKARCNSNSKRSKTVGCGFGSPRVRGILKSSLRAVFGRKIGGANRRPKQRLDEQRRAAYCKAVIGTKPSRPLFIWIFT